MELWLVRHGETEANEKRVISGWSDVSLTAKGEAQAKAVGPMLENTSFDSVWSSDLKRAVATARLAFAEPKRDARLREMHFGDMEGKPFEEIDDTFKRSLLEFVDFRAPGGEGMSEFRSRLDDFLSTLRPGRHLLFTHGGVIRAMTKDLGEDRFIGNGGLVAIDMTLGRILFVREVDPESSPTVKWRKGN